MGLTGAYKIVILFRFYGHSLYPLVIIFYVNIDYKRATTKFGNARTLDSPINFAPPKVLYSADESGTAWNLCWPHFYHIGICGHQWHNPKG